MYYCPGDHKYFNTSSHNSSHMFPSNLSLHLLQCNSNTFNSNACIYMFRGNYNYFNTTAPISIQLRSFQPIQPFRTNSNVFSLTAATFQSCCSFFKILLLLSRATCMHFKRSYYVEPTAVIFVWLHPFLVPNTIFSS